MKYLERRLYDDPEFDPGVALAAARAVGAVVKFNACHGPDGRFCSDRGGGVIHYAGPKQPRTPGNKPRAPRKPKETAADRALGATPAIREARKQQRAENAASALEEPVVRYELERGSARHLRAQIDAYDRRIKEVEAAVREPAAWQLAQERHRYLVSQANNWGLSRRERADWEKQLEAHKAEYDRLQDLHENGPAQLASYKKTRDAYEHTLRTYLTQTREVNYAQALERNPDMIPPGPIGGRIAKYHVGEAKRQAVLAIADKYQNREIDLANQRANLTKRIYANTDEQANLLAPHTLTGGPIPADVHAKIDALDKANDGLAATREAIRARQQALADERDKAIHKVLKVENGAQFRSVPIEDGFRTQSGPLAPAGGETAKAARSAEKWLGAHVAKGDQAELPVMIGEGPGYRAHCGPKGDYIQVKTGERPDVVVHEYGHALEARMHTAGVPLKERSLEFLYHRVGDETPVDLKQKFDAGDPGEMGRKDKFDRAFNDYQAHYVGKDYGDRATEILSMGLQRLYNNPGSFARDDPEYFKLVAGLADGALR